MVVPDILRAVHRRTFLALAAAGAPLSLPGLAGLAGLAGCAAADRKDVDDLARLYAAIPSQRGRRPDPVLFLPGLLGSELTDTETDTILWGRFLAGTMKMDDPAFLQAIGLPMFDAQTTSLAELTDSVKATGALLNAEIKIGKKIIEINAYPNIISGVLAQDQSDLEGRVTRSQLWKAARNDPDSSPVNASRTFGFDWRRDLSEAAVALHGRVLAEVDAEVARLQAEGERDVVPEDVRIDVVAHSLGSQVARYYLRYGATPLPDDGSLPEVTWAGAKHIRRLILIAPPNTGSLYALSTLIYGNRPMAILPSWPSALVCTYPAMFQLMPHPDLEPVIYDDDGTKVDLYDVAMWERFDWGPFAPGQAKVLEALVPGVPDRTGRLSVARRHVQRCLDRAAQLHRALDRRGATEPDVSVHLFASDAIETEARYWIDRNTGRISRVDYDQGDSVVTRDSALADMRLLRDPRARIRSSIPWHSVCFSGGDHLSMLGDPDMADNLLYLLLQHPV